MKVSLVLSTYNGSKYIIPQLDSLRNQTRKIDEVIIRDDKSTDDTCIKIESYIKHYSLDWIFVRGQHNLGWRDAFYEITKMATGDVVFFCDQDDIWNEKKVEVMTECFKDPEVHLLVADCIRFHYDNVPNDWENSDSQIEKFDTTYRWPYIQRPGCTMAFDNVIRELYLQIFQSGDAHDLLVWQIAGALDSIWHINFNSIFFRRHDTNSTPTGVRTLEGRLKDVAGLLNISNRLAMHLKAYPVATDRVGKFHNYVIRRNEFLNKKSILNLAKILPYYKYYTSYKAILADVLSK